MTILEDKYLFYAKYHQNKCNKYIHYFCIPILIWTIFIFTNYIPLEYQILHNFSINTTEVPENLQILVENTPCALSIRTSVIVLVSYHIYYCYLSLGLGISSFIFYSIFWYTASLAYCINNHIYILSLFLHIISWILQIIGHKIFEGNSPAFTTSISQSFIMAPLFVMYDLGICCKCIKKKNPIVKYDISETLI